MVWMYQRHAQSGVGGAEGGVNENMIERVARAICASEYDENFPGLSARVDKMWPLWTAHARAAIKSMREPTEAMAQVSAMAICVAPGTARVTQWAANKWSDMIDAALSETP